MLLSRNFLECEGNRETQDGDHCNDKFMDVTR